MTMKTIVALLLACGVCLAQAPIQRNYWTTNTSANVYGPATWQATNSAHLTALADGATVYMDSSLNTNVMAAGSIHFGLTPGVSQIAYPFSDASYPTPTPTVGYNTCFYSYAVDTPNYQLVLDGPTITGISGGGSYIELFTHRTFAPTSGSSAFCSISLTPVINQTGGANGNAMGLNIDPSLVSASEWYSIYLGADKGHGIYQIGAGSSNYFNGQVGIGAANPHPSAALEVRSTTKGWLLPRATTTQINAISAPAQGLQFFSTDCLSSFPPGTGAQVVFDGTNWRIHGVGTIMTTVERDYLLSLITNGRNFAGSVDFSFLDEGWNKTSNPWATSFSSGGNAQVTTTSDTSGYIGDMYATTGSATNGYAGMYADSSCNPGASGGRLFYQRVFFGSLSSADDVFWASVGLSGTHSGTFPVTAILFVYDPSNVLGLGINNQNWWYCTRVTSTYNLTDTGVAVSTSVSAPSRLGIHVLSSSLTTQLLLNGSWIATLPGNIPSGAMGIDMRIVKSGGNIGTTACSLHSLTVALAGRQSRTIP